MEEGGEQGPRNPGRSQARDLGAEVRAAPVGPNPVEIGNSRVSPGHVYRVVQSFSQYKKDLINVIGFGGILSMPNLAKINLRFSLWLLGHVDIKSQGIVVDEERMIRFFAEDVEKVFGIPCGPRRIDGLESQVAHESIQFMRASLGLTDRDAHSLKRVEAFLHKEVSESSSRLEQECFQIAFVIFVMGHFLSPSNKHDYVTIDYWGTLRSAEHITNYNWCSCIIRSVIDAARKVQSACHGKGPIAIPGCHLFLQVFFLDNIDVGAYNLPHNVFPRIKVFDPGRMKIMLQRSVHAEGADDMYAVALPRFAESVCYKRHEVEHSKSIGEPVNQKWRCSETAKDSSPMAGKPDPQEEDSTGPNLISQVWNAPAQTGDISGLDISKYLSPTGFFEYFKMKYPNLISCGVMDVLKRHNAMCIKHHVEQQRAVIKENIQMVERLIEMLGQQNVQEAGKFKGTFAVRPSVGSGTATPDCSGTNNQDFSREGQGESSISNSCKRVSKGLPNEQPTKRASGTSMSVDALRSKRSGTEGCYSVSSGRARATTLEEDMPTFDLGVEPDADGNLSASSFRTPEPSARAKGQQSPRSRNKAFSELIVGEMLSMQNEKKMLVMEKYYSVTPQQHLSHGKSLSRGNLLKIHSTVATFIPGLSLKFWYHYIFGRWLGRCWFGEPMDLLCTEM